MSSILTIVALTFSIILTPFLIFFCGIVFLAAIGKTLGVRRRYVMILLKVFEYGRESIEKNLRQKYSSSSGEDSDSENSASKRSGGDPSVTDSGGITISEIVRLQGDKTHRKNGRSNGHAVLINRDTEEHLSMLPYDFQSRNNNKTDSAKDSPEKRVESSEVLETTEFQLGCVLDYVKNGMEAIIEDQVTSRFEAEELKSWNLLTRTNRNYEFINWRITVIWVIGFWLRYAFLLPLRILICFFGVMWLTVCTAVVGYVPNGPFKKWLNARVFILCCRVLSSALSVVIDYHGLENRPKCGICVANHTSPIDALMLACDNCYSLIGQRHGGFLGVLQRALARASPHIWFERDEAKDRVAVAERLRQHVSDANNPPILIFPEGTCINNTSVMQFKKGSFEVDTVIYPVAIKYDPRFGDAFWNSSKYSMMQYLYLMMTSWAIVCDVWYLPPMRRNADESAVEFANRVKRAIAQQGGLVDLMWDGQLKRAKPKKEWKEKQQEEFSKRLKIN